MRLMTVSFSGSFRVPPENISGGDMRSQKMRNAAVLLFIVLGFTSCSDMRKNISGILHH